VEKRNTNDHREKLRYLSIEDVDKLLVATGDMNLMTLHVRFISQWDEYTTDEKHKQTCFKTSYPQK